MENIQEKINEKKTTPPYKLGYLGIIPLVGFFIGIGLTLYGIFRYKDRKLTLIGISCMLFTILVYSSLFYFSNYSDFAKKGSEKIAQIELNSLVKDIEYYKLQKGSYPDNLKQLQSQNKMVSISDPTQSRIGKDYFNYKKLGEKYILFSYGSDRIKNTVDDIFPQIENLKNVGWIRNSNSR